MRAILLHGYLVTLLAACSPALSQQRLEYRQLASAAVGEVMQYAVYQPRDRKPQEELPLVVFLHGAGDGPDCFDRARIGDHLDQSLAAGRVPRAVIALPQGDISFWENEVDGPHQYRDWVLDEMMPRVQTEYRTLSCPEACHVMGISMGGYGAMRFAYQEPQRFASVTAISAPIFDTDQMLDFRDSFWWGLLVPIDRIWGSSRDRRMVSRDDPFLHWHRRRDLKELTLMLAWGNADHSGIIENNTRFHEHLSQVHVAHHAVVFEGGHDWEAWTPVIEGALVYQVRGSR